MKTLLSLALVLSSTVASAKIQISAGEIALKSSDLVTTAERSVNGVTQTILLDSAGISLYTFDLDSVGVSACKGGCLTVWPPLHVPAAAELKAPYGKILGNDGKDQLTLNGLPLYYYNKDKVAGQVLGQYPSWETIVVVPNLQVSASAIEGKSDLVTTATRDVNGVEQTILLDAAGVSLYTFDLDTDGVSACEGACLVAWPPLHVPAGSLVEAPFGIIKGNDGVDQLTLNGLPLYYYVRDKVAGDVFGQYPEWETIVIAE